MKQANRRSLSNESIPLVSVVMPNYNTPEPYLRCAIESILSQTYANLELIIIDDASTGNDVDVIRSYKDDRITLLRNEVNRHIAYTMNRGIGVARGDYIARMDSDDISLPWRIEKQVRFMQRRRDIDIVCAQARMFGKKKGVFAPHLTRPEHMRTEIFFGCSVVHPTVMFRTSFIREHALRYKDNLCYRAAEDYELWSRSVYLGRICEYPRVLLYYRVHSLQISSASSGKQITSTRRIRADQLRLLGIVPSEQEALLHDSFCTESAKSGFSLAETEAWARRMLAANAQTGALPRGCFKHAVVQRYFVTAVKHLLARRVSLRGLIQLRLSRTMLLPFYFPGYLMRFLFSKRLNRVI